LACKAWWSRGATSSTIRTSGQRYRPRQPPAALRSGAWLQCRKAPRAPRQASEWRGPTYTRVREAGVFSLSNRRQHVLKTADPNGTLIDGVEAGLIQQRHDFTWVDVTMAVE